MPNTKNHWVNNEGWCHDDLTKRPGSVGYSIEKYINQINSIDDIDELRCFFFDVVMDPIEIQGTSEEKKQVYMEQANKIDDVDRLKGFIYAIHGRARDYKRRLARRWE